MTALYTVVTCDVFETSSVVVPATVWCLQDHIFDVMTHRLSPPVSVLATVTNTDVNTVSVGVNHKLCI